MVEQDLPPSQITPADEPEQVITQHNALINASFSLKPLELRLFLAMLKRVRYGDSEFKEYFIPTDELADTQSGGTAYRNVKAMAKAMTKQSLDIEAMETYGTKPKAEAWQGKSWLSIPLMGIAYYEEGSGGIMASFNHRLIPYLLDLKGNFTQASLQQLTQCRSVYSYRIYLLLREFGKQGKRTMSIAELRYKLGIGPDEYAGRFNNFKARVLDTAQRELDKTDMPFTYEVKKVGKKLDSLEFRFKAVTATKEPQQVRDEIGEKWAEYLLDRGIHQSDIGKIAVLLKSNAFPNTNYTLDYLRFVVDYVDAQTARGKAKSPVGLMREALVKSILMGSYENQLKKKGLLKMLPLMQTTLELGERIPLEAPQPEKKPLRQPEGDEEVLTMSDVLRRYEALDPNDQARYTDALNYAYVRLQLNENYTRSLRDGLMVWVRQRPAPAPSARPGKDILGQLG